MGPHSPAPVVWLELHVGRSGLGGGQDMVHSGACHPCPSQARPTHLHTRHCLPCPGARPLGCSVHERWGRLWLLWHKPVGGRTESLFGVGLQTQAVKFCVAPFQTAEVKPHVRRSLRAEACHARSQGPVLPFPSRVACGRHDAFCTAEGPLQGASA